MANLVNFFGSLTQLIKAHLHGNQRFPSYYSNFIIIFEYFYYYF